jgi:CrcB protein
MPRHRDDLRPGADHVVDPDVDLHDPAQRGENRPHAWDLLLAIAVGGVLGAEARYGLSVAMPYSGGAFPWATVVVNVAGCLLIGMLMAGLAQLRPHRLVRPFLGTGLLGGFTTYSTFAVDAEALIRAQHPGAALGYVVVTLACCLLAVVAGTMGVRSVARRRVAVAVR